MYRDDVDNMIHRHEDVRQNLKQHVVDEIPPKAEYMVQVSNGNFVMGTKDILPVHQVSGVSSVCRTVYISGTNKWAIHFHS